DRFVLVLLGPAMDRVHELAGDALPAMLRRHAVEPGEVDGRLELEAHEEADGFAFEAGHQHERGVAAEKAAAPRLQFAVWPEDLILKRADGRQLFGTDQVNDRVGHGSISSGICYRAGRALGRPAGIKWTGLP